ncbi:MAG: ATP-binding protein [Alphaproteobacteria bacterium]|nr:ATP-binding protein [Alphaproteobacteria bacterium]
MPISSNPIAPLPEFSADAVCDVLPLALIAMDDAYRIFYANAAAERLLNVSAKVMHGRLLAEIIDLDSSWQALLLQATDYHNGAKGYDLHLKPLRSGETAKVHVHITNCQPFVQNAQSGRIMVLENIAASEKLENHANQRSTMRSAAVMGHILAHEVRNPLSGIKGAAQLLHKTTQDADDKSLLTLIISEVERISGLMGQVEYFSTQKPIETTAVNIHEVLRYVTNIAKQGWASHVEFFEQYDPSLPEVQGNRELLIQAIMNLVKNAAEAVQDVHVPRISLSTAYRSGYRVAMAGSEILVNLPICVQISDNGSGIADDMRGQIFDPFVTGKNTGKGLGLAVVAKVVADHGGVIALESSTPGNTVFSLQLPAVTTRT